MGDDKEQPPLTSADYDAIEAAVMETERGRWFLKEYARRNRNTDSLVVLQALDHIGRLIKGLENRKAATPPVGTGAEAGHPPALPAAPAAGTRSFPSGAASEEAPKRQAVRALRETASNLRSVALRIQDTRNALLGPGPGRLDGDPAIQDDLSAFSPQDEASGRIDEILRTLRYLEERINTMITICDHTPGD